MLHQHCNYQLPTEMFTEFYILGQEGEATGYPQELKIGEEGEVIVVIVNHEHEEVNYRLELRIDGVVNSQIEEITLEDNEKWEEIVSFKPTKVGDSQQVEFLLYRNGMDEPHLEPLHFWIDVTD